MFTALAIVILVSQLFGQVLARFGQPRVMGEILGGIALGPSLLGWIAPSLEEQLFGGGILDELFCSVRKRSYIVETKTSTRENNHLCAFVLRLDQFHIFCWTIGR